MAGGANDGCTKSLYFALLLVSNPTIIPNPKGITILFARFFTFNFILSPLHYMQEKRTKLFFSCSF